MIKQLAVECLLTQPKLNNLADILQILADSQDESERVLAAKYLSKIFKFYWDNKLLKDNNPVAQFIWNKLVSFAQLLTIRLLENTTLFSELLGKLVLIEHLAKKSIVTESVVTQMISSSDEIWGKISNGEILTKLINELNKREKVYHAKVAVITELNQQISFVPYLTQQKDIKRQRNGEAVVQTSDNQDLRKAFKRQFESLLVDFLRDDRVPQEFTNRVLSKLGQSIYSKMQSPLILSEYVMHTFLHSNSLETKVNALAALYILIGKYGLELENFYERLLDLTTSKVEGKNIFQNPKCKRVYRLIQNALRSSKVPFKIVCRFVKILFEQILIQKSQFGCWAMALIFNITKKHRNILSCLKNSQILLQQQQQQSQLISLSEIQLMRNHYLPQVRSILNEMSKDLSKVDFLDIEEISKLKIQKLLNKKIQELMNKQVQFELPDILHPLII